ncbi:glycosyltransferase [Mesorhizobium sp. M1399]|uniref:glycosyltransferase n=1 Tax=Mesorhizobium sp. M1399 TaxID=2957096 RepID=UPI0033379849
MKKALFVVDRNPFPARNGVTIPVSNYIRICREIGLEVTILLARKKAARWPLIGFLWEILLECVGVRPAFSLTLRNSDLERIEGPEIQDSVFDLVVCSPITVCELGSELSFKQVRTSNRKPLMVAGVSDSYAVVLRKFSKSPSIAFFSRVIAFFRSYIVAKHETEILRGYDSIICQTDRDVANFSRYLRNPDRLIQLSNGVNEQLFSLKQEFNNCFVYVADLRSRQSQERILWLWRAVWLNVVLERKVLHIFTSGLPLPPYLNEMRSDATVIFHEDFASSVLDIYRGMAFSLAPIFQEYGFINKVAEALAAGCVVIGDRTAFNGIDFPEREMCIANTETEWLALVNRFNRDRQYYEVVRNASTEYARRTLSWKRHKKYFSSLIDQNGPDQR